MAEHLTVTPSDNPNDPLLADVLRGPHRVRSPLTGSYFALPLHGLEDLDPATTRVSVSFKADAGTPLRRMRAARR